MAKAKKQEALSVSRLINELTIAKLIRVGLTKKGFLNVQEKVGLLSYKIFWMIIILRFFQNIICARIHRTI